MFTQQFFHFMPVVVKDFEFCNAEINGSLSSCLSYSDVVYICLECPPGIHVLQSNHRCESGRGQKFKLIVGLRDGGIRIRKVEALGGESGSIIRRMTGQTDTHMCSLILNM